MNAELRRPDKANRLESQPPHKCRLLVSESRAGSTLLEMVVPEGAGMTCHFYTWGEGIERMRMLRLRGRGKRSRKERHDEQKENDKHG